MNKSAKDKIRSYARNTIPEELSFIGRTLIIPANAPVGACPTCQGSPVYIVPRSDGDTAGGVYVSCLVMLTQDEIDRLGVKLSDVREYVKKSSPSTPRKSKPKVRATKGGGQALLHQLSKQQAELDAELERLKQEVMDDV